MILQSRCRSSDQESNSTASHDRHSDLRELSGIPCPQPEARHHFLQVLFQLDNQIKMGWLVGSSPSPPSPPPPPFGFTSGHTAAGKVTTPYDWRWQKQHFTTYLGELSHKATCPSAPEWVFVMDERRALGLPICYMQPCMYNLFYL